MRVEIQRIENPPCPRAFQRLKAGRALMLRPAEIPVPDGDGIGQRQRPGDVASGRFMCVTGSCVFSGAREKLASTGLVATEYKMLRSGA